MIDDNDIDHFICKQREVKEMIRKKSFMNVYFLFSFLSISLISEDGEKQKQKEDNYQGN